MKTIAASVIAGMLAMTASSTYIQPTQTTNYVVNGDFKDNTCPNNFCIWDQTTFTPNNVPGWRPVPEIEIGKGSIYNNFPQGTYVAELDPNYNTCITQDLFDLPKGRYQLSFDWAARWDRPFKDNIFSVHFGGLEIGTITPSDYDIHTNVAYIELPYGCTYSELRFCGQGESTSYGTVITNIKLQRKGQSIHPPKYPPKPEKPEIYIEIPVPTKPDAPYFPHPEKPDIQNPGPSKPVWPGYEPPTKPTPPTKDIWVPTPNKPDAPYFPHPEKPDIQNPGPSKPVWPGYEPPTKPTPPIKDVWVPTPTKPTPPDFTYCKGNLVKNGGFEEGTCQLDYCIYDIWNFDPSYVPGWTPVNEIEIGTGNIYNSQAGPSRVAQLDPNANSCILQTIKTCDAGKYILKFDYAARQGTVLGSSKIEVIVNGQIVAQIAPQDYQYYEEKIILNLGQGANDIKFCAAGTSDSFGAIIDNVDVRTADCEECKSKIVQKKPYGDKPQYGYKY